MDLLSLCTHYSEKQQIRNSHFKIEHVSMYLVSHIEISIYCIQIQFGLSVR